MVLKYYTGPAWMDQWSATFAQAGLNHFAGTTHVYVTVKANSVDGGHDLALAAFAIHAPDALSLFTGLGHPMPVNRR